MISRAICQKEKSTPQSAEGGELGSIALKSNVVLGEAVETKRGVHQTAR